jgi:hypothetical protein
MTRNDLTNILASCLESIEQGERTVEECLAFYPEQREELKSLLDTVAIVRERANFSPRPGFHAASRARLIGRLVPHRSPAIWESDPRAKRKAQPVFSKRFAMLWAAVFVLVVSLLGGGTVYASQSALPGDALHPVKLTVEDARLFLAGDAEDVSLAAGFAQARLEEIQSLIELNREEDLPLAVDLFSNRIADAADSLAAVARSDPERAAQLGHLLEESFSLHTETLNLLLPTVPDAAKPAIEHAILASSRGQGAVQKLIGNRPPGGGPPEDLPGPEPEKIPPGGGPPEESPEPVTPPPGGGPPDRTPGPPTWVPGGKP